ncbi:hypothetical protein VaNZ11_014970, partial [Volvox africanus]
LSLGPPRAVHLTWHLSVKLRQVKKWMRMPDATASAARLSTGRDASAAATPTDMFGRKRRLYPDEDNDSASEANSSLLAMIDQQREQLTAPDGADDASNNNNVEKDYSSACAQDDANATGEAGQRKRQQREPERPRRRRRAGGRVTLDNLGEALVASRTYREWTLDSSVLLKSRINVAPDPSGGSDPGHNPGLVRASGTTATGPFVDPVNGRCFTSAPYDGTPGPMICGAVAGMLAAGHVAAASDAVRHGAAAMLNGSSMTWGRHPVAKATSCCRGRAGCRPGAAAVHGEERCPPCGHGFWSKGQRRAAAQGTTSTARDELLRRRKGRGRNRGSSRSSPEASSPRHAGRQRHAAAAPCSGAWTDGRRPLGRVPVKCCRQRGNPARPPRGAMRAAWAGRPKTRSYGTYHVQSTALRRSVCLEHARWRTCYRRLTK